MHQLPPFSLDAQRCWFRLLQHLNTSGVKKWSLAGCHLRSIQHAIRSFFFFAGNQRADSEDGFVILDVAMKNNGADPLIADFQPVVRLMDDEGRLYEHSIIRTVQLNFGKSTARTGFESVNPGTTMRNVLVFEAPKSRYTVQVMVPDRLKMAFAGSIKKIGPYFLYDISSQL